MKRYELSLVRFCSTLMIIFCHTFEHIGYTLGVSEKLGIIGNFLAVGVQIFLLLSGFLYGLKQNLYRDKAVGHWIGRNFLKILNKYYIYVFIVIFPIHFFVYYKKVSVFTMLYYAFKVLTTSDTIWGVHHLWFIPYILACYLITPVLYKIKLLSVKYNHIFSACFGVMILIELADIAFDSYFIAAWINCYVFGFFAPAMINKLKESSKKIITAVLICSFLPTVIAWYHVRYFIQPNCSESILNYVCDYVINYLRSIDALILFMIIFLIGRAAFKGIGRHVRWLDLADKYAYNVYIVHMIYIKGVLSLLALTTSYLFNIFIMLIATAASAVILEYASIKLTKAENKLFAKMAAH